MPSANTTDDKPGPDYSMLDADTPTSRRRSSHTAVPISNQQPEGRSTAAPRPHRDSQDVKSHNNERESKKSQTDRELPVTPAVIITTTAGTTTTTTTKQKSPPSSTDRQDARTGRSSRPEATSDSDSSDSLTESYEEVMASDDPRGREQFKGPTSTTGSKLTRVTLTSQPASYAQAVGRSSKDPQHLSTGAAEGSAPRGSTTSQASMGRPSNAQDLPGHLPEGEQQEMSEIVQPTQGANYSQGVMGTILSFMPATGPSTPKDKHQLLKDNFRQVQHELKQAYADLEGCKHELRRSRTEIRSANHYINELHHEKQRWKDHMGGLQNELNNVHQQLKDAKTLSEVRGKELFGAQVFLTKADTLSISEVGEKVTALNEEIFQAAATLGEALIHHRYELSQDDFNAAAVESRKMVGEKISTLLNSQAQKTEPEVNPLLVQVVLQIFMVKFCVSKIRSWYPSDSAVGDFLNAIYSAIRSSEEQAVSGRWRALTRAHTRPTTETWTTELSQKLVCVLKIAAWVPGSPESQESFANRLPPIFKAINELRIAIGEKFTSADLDISVFDCDLPYEPSYMEDAYGDGRQPNAKRATECVVGTTGIGLKKLMVERSAKDALHFQSVISAKVVLESTLKEALEPVQSSTRLRKKKRVENTDGADQEGRNSSKSNAGPMGK